MKKSVVFGLIFLLAFTLQAFAQMKQQGGEMMESHEKMGQKPMMEEKEMRQKMEPCMGKMESMMQKMNQMSKKEMSTENRQKLAALMRDMAKNMIDMSDMMEKGYCSMEEMQKMEKGVEETQEKFEMLDEYL